MIQALTGKIRKFFTPKWSKDDEHRLEELRRYEHWLTFDLPWRIASARAQLETFKRQPFTNSKEGKRERSRRLAELQRELHAAQTSVFSGNCVGDLGYVRNQIRRLQGKKARVSQN